MIYLDNAATTKTAKEVVEAMLPYYAKQYANPSSNYDFSAASKKAVLQARRIIAESIGAQPEEIYFTSGGSEADSWAIISAARANKDKGRHIITSKIEHHAVLHTCAYLEKNGFEVSYIPVNENGIVKLEELFRAMRPDTILVSIMFANNEIGTIQPIAKIGEEAAKRGILFHTDAVQAYGHIPTDVQKNQIDFLSASGHKLYGPKGTGFLYIRKDTNMEALIFGGGQEQNMRAGTENVPGIVGLGKAAEIAEARMMERLEHETKLRNYLIERVLGEISYSRLNGDKKLRLPNNANFSFQFTEGETLLVMLNNEGICASSGSACTSSQRAPSHVLASVGLPEELAHNSLRLTLSHETTREEIDYVVDKIKTIVMRLRKTCPLFEEFNKQG